MSIKSYYSQIVMSGKLSGKKFCYRASKKCCFFVLITESILTIMFWSTVNSMWFNVWNCRFWWSIRFVCNWFRVIVVEWVCICNSMTMIDGCIYSRKSFSIAFLFSDKTFLVFFFILTVLCVIWIWKKVYGTRKVTNIKDINTHNLHVTGIHHQNDRL